MQGRSKRGAFILFEGIDRVGKTTQVNNLLEYLKDRKVPTHHMRFPNRTTGMGKMIDSYLKNASDLNDRQIHLLFSANRHEFSSVIKEKLNAGFSVICDRYCFSGAAYTSAKEAKKPENKKRPPLDYEWCILPDEGLPSPDLIIFLDMDVKQAALRGSYGEERYEKLDFQMEVQRSFHNIHKITSSLLNWKVIDAAQKPEIIGSQIAEAVEMCFENLPEQIALLTRQSFGLKIQMS